MSSATKIFHLPSETPAATKVVHLSGVFEMRRGGLLPAVDIAYETWGTLNGAKDNAVLLFTGLSPGAHAASSPDDPTPGWWEYMVGPGKPIDTDRYYVICVNSLGSCFGSTGPASVDTRSGRRYRLNFPQLTVEDIALAGLQAVRALGIERLHTVVGTSLGGMTALALAVQYPDSMDNLVLISSAGRALPTAIAIRSLQREIVRSDPAWKNGNYEFGAGPVQGMRMARKLGLISYRSSEEWQQRFGRERTAESPAKPFGIEFEVESYVEANARKFAARFDANSYLYLSHASDLFDIDEHGDGLDGALDRLRTRRNLIIGVDSDFLFPLQQQLELADGMRRVGLSAEFHPLTSLQGHDAFLVDKARFAPVLEEFFARG